MILTLGPVVEGDDEDGETLRSPQVSCSRRSGGHGVLMVSGLSDDRPIRPSWFSPIRIFFMALVDDLYGQTVVVIVSVFVMIMTIVYHRDDHDNCDHHDD